MKKFVSLLAMLLLIIATNAQGNSGSNQFFLLHLKIYLSIGALTIILGFIFLFLFSMERRLKKLEKN